VVHDLPEKEFVEWVHRLGGTPSQIWQDPQLRELVIPILRGDFRLFASFDPETNVGPPLESPITAFGGLADRAVSYDGLNAWKERTRAGARLYMLPGDHFFVHSARDLLLERVVRVLRDRMEGEALGGAGLWP
jgi:medium-chain acyl-[acyl-carrier-protein] hydrolase